ncbi:MAG: DNA-directed RNA polymerase subunit F [Candidatus Pacearchaeota archaeon]|nr:DNA-directed RNA polymerase subunit F [Candidatus Pacearchaeota archaeon]
MILEMKPLSLAEVKEIIKDSEENKDLKDYLKKFGKLNEEKAKKLEEELKALNNMKLKDEFIVKIIDFLPRDAEDLNKIFIEVSLDNKETNEVLDILKKY